MDMDSLTQARINGSDRDTTPSKPSDKNNIGSSANFKGTERQNPKKSKSKPKKGSSQNNSQEHSTRRHGQYRRKLQKQYESANGNDPIEGNFNTSLEEEIIGGNFKLRGRKTQVSIKHLLDFNLPKIERNSEHDSSRHRKITRMREQNQEHLHLSGDSFINVNYRFLVKNVDDYNEQMNNPNIPIPEDNISRVIVPKGQNCPICLGEEPIAPRMVSCGHIFCLSCLINFFSVEEIEKNQETGYTKKKKYKDCPLCGNIVRPQRVKAVMYQEDDRDLSNDSDVNPKSGLETELKLMCKSHDLLLPLPINLHLDPKLIGNYPNFNMKKAIPFAHIMKCDTTTELENFQKDIDAISTQYEIDKALYNQDKKYVNLAIESINDKIAAVLSDETAQIELAASNSEDLQNFVLQDNFDVKAEYDDMNAFFFYQTAFQSTTKFFLSHLDVKILLSTFSHYSKFPDTLKIHIENVHYGTIVTEQLIRRYKYIGHLPLGTELAFIDIDWRKIDFLPKEISEQFSQELKQRRRDYNRRKQKEDMQKKIYQQKLEEDQMKFYREENSSYISLQDSSDLESIRNSPTVLDTLGSVSSRNIPDNNDSSNTSKKDSKNKYKETTIWGTSISVMQDEKMSRENQEFEDMLLQRMKDEAEPNDNSSSHNGSTLQLKNGKKKKKGKVLLFSNNHQTI